MSDDTGDVNVSLNSSSETPDDEYSGWICYVLTPDSQDGPQEITDETIKFQADYLRDLGATTQINAIAPAADSDNHDSDILRGKMTSSEIRSPHWQITPQSRY